MKLSLGYSPCPNDTFIFDALVNKKIDSEGLEFDVVLEDVETLNKWSFEKKLDITKLSFPAFFQNSDKYVLLNSGAALGKGVGPILISKYSNKLQTSNLKHQTIVLPGKNTTANLLFSFAYPEANNKVFMRFDKIEDFLLNESPKVSLPGGGGDLDGAAILGVIIHETRFTYQQKGLHKVTDLGEFWEEKMHAPIPLGGIVVSRSIDKETSPKIDKLIRKSIEFAFANYPLITDYVKQHSQEMSEEVMRQHIELYVNNFSIDLGEEGRKAIMALYETFLKSQSTGNFVQSQSKSLFL
ncbi:MAG TPA: 1,4-dihydroxy-6-naphthoate synthase [Chitinophagaceae bacterium]|nr:1,4-dihydroxy-6-naphthoate synthase [Chitinophagaceae bacterium]